MTENEQYDYIPPAFPHIKAISSRLSWGLHLDLFAGGSQRLTARGYKAYMGYLFALLVLLFLTIGIVTGLIGWIGFGLDYGWAKLIAGLLFIVFSVGVLVLLQNAFRAFIYRLHDLGLNGWWLLIFYIFAFVLDGVFSSISGLNVTVLSASISLLPFVLQAAPVKNQYGFPAEFLWYSFPWPVRWGGEATFWMSALGLGWAVIALFI